MFQLVYMSQVTEMFTSKTIDDILEKSKKNNLRLGITGMLIEKNGVFFQLLEGDKKNVLETYGRICNDLRHTLIRVLVTQEVEERIFPHWSMAFKGGDSISQEQIEKMNQWRKLLEQTQNQEIVSKSDLWLFFANIRYDLTEEKYFPENTLKTG